MDDRAAMELAGSQHGLITFDQAAATGLTRNQIQHRLNAGMLQPLHEGVYRYAAVPPTWEQRLLAACLATGSLAAVSHRAAAAMHELWWLTDDLVEITVSPDRSPAMLGVVVHRVSDLTPRWIMTIDGIAVTTPARLLVDLGAVLPLGMVARVFDRAIGRRIVSVSEVRSAMRAVARRGRTGVGTVRQLIAERSDARAGTVLELRMAALVRRYSLPAPAPEHTVLDEQGQFVARVDFAYPELRYAIEVDGYEPHTAVRAFEHDRVRQNDLIDQGWTVHRFTWSEIETRPARVAERIRARHCPILGTLKLTGAA